MTKKRVFHKKGIGRVDVFPLKIPDFNEMCRICLVNRDRAPNVKKRRMWWRNYLLLVIGANTGVRIEGVLQLMPRDLAGGQLCIKETKTNKLVKFEINKLLYDAIIEYVEEYDLTEREYLFSTESSKKPITRQRAYDIIKRLAKMAGVKSRVGCHSLRKSYARWEYDKSGDLVKVSRMLGHASPLVTLQYICLEEKAITEARKKSTYGL